MTRDERITKLRKGRWIRYPRAEQILAQLDELLKHPKTHRMPTCVQGRQTGEISIKWRSERIARVVPVQILPGRGNERAGSEQWIRFAGRHPAPARYTRAGYAPFWLATLP